MRRFAGKVAIVTGAGSGFGEAIATRFAREGARVLVADVHEENGRRVTAAIEREDGNARFVRTDVSRASDVKAMIDAETGLRKTALGVDKLPDDFRKQLVAGVPLGRLTEPRDVAAAVLFLASDEAEFLTGVCLAVDGGRSIS